MKTFAEPIRFCRPLREVRLRPDRKPHACVDTRELEEAAFERGRREGEKALSEQLIRQRSELIELQNGLFQSLRKLLPDAAQECEKALVALALELAARLTAGVPISAELVEATVREALSRVEENSEFTVCLNPEDFELLQRMNSPLLLNEAAGGRMRIRTSGEVTRGGCIIETRFGILDARRETKLALLRNSLEI
jgi:flagellar assembly protein FliH